MNYNDYLLGVKDRTSSNKKIEQKEVEPSDAPKLSEKTEVWIKKGESKRLNIADLEIKTSNKKINTISLDRRVSSEEINQREVKKSDLIELNPKMSLSAEKASLERTGFGNRRAPLIAERIILLGRYGAQKASRKISEKIFGDSGTFFGINPSLYEAEDRTSGSKIKTATTEDRTSGSEIKTTISEDRTSDGKIKTTTTEDRTSGSEIKTTISKDRASGSKIKTTETKDRTSGSKIKTTTTKDRTSDGKIKTTTTKDRASGSKIKTTETEDKFVSSTSKISEDGLKREVFLNNICFRKNGDEEFKIKDVDSLRPGAGAVGYIYVMPQNEDEGFEIPFEFTPSIKEGTYSAQYNAHNVLARIGGMQSYSHTELSTPSITANYYALVSKENETSSSYGQSWMNDYTLEKIQSIQRAFEALVLPKFPSDEESNATKQFSYVRPPFVKIVIGDESASTLFTYPPPSVEENEGRSVLASQTEKWRRHKTFLVTSVSIDKNLQETPLVLSETEGKIVDTFGFEVSLDLVEAPMSYMDVLPDFQNYFNSFKTALCPDKE